MKALVSNSTGKGLQWRGRGHCVNCRALKLEIFLFDSICHPLRYFPLAMTHGSPPLQKHLLTRARARVRRGALAVSCRMEWNLLVSSLYFNPYCTAEGVCFHTRTGPFAAQGSHPCRSIDNSTWSCYELSGMKSSSVSPIFGYKHPKDPAVLKTLRDSKLLRRSVFTTPPIFTTLRTLRWEEECL